MGETEAVAAVAWGRKRPWQRRPGRFPAKKFKFYVTRRPFRHLHCVTEERAWLREGEWYVARFRAVWPEGTGEEGQGTSLLFHFL